MEEEIRNLGKIYRNGNGDITAGKAMRILSEIYYGENYEKRIRELAGKELGYSRLEIILETNPVLKFLKNAMLKTALIGGTVAASYGLCKIFLDNK